MRRQHPALFPMALGLLGLAGLGSLVDSMRSGQAVEGLEEQLVSVEAECQLRLGATTVATDIVVLAPFATWAAVTSGLHEAHDRSGLETFSYETGGVIDCLSPDAPLPLPDDAEELSERALQESDGELAQDLPYRAMTSSLSGSGSYDSIVRFVSALASVDPPLALDDLTIVAGPKGPSFTGHVHLTTALDVAPPHRGNIGELLLADLLDARENQDSEHVRR